MFSIVGIEKITKLYGFFSSIRHYFTYPRAVAKPVLKDLAAQLTTLIQQGEATGKIALYTFCLRLEHGLTTELMPNVADPFR
jgi:hypothetical protein